MFFQLATEETLVPPNFRTTHGEGAGDIGAGEAVAGAPDETPDAASAVVMCTPFEL
jgi:hypothetical protein